MKKIDFSKISKEEYLQFLLKRKKISSLFDKPLSTEKIIILNEFLYSIKIEDVLNSSPTAYNFIVLCKIVNSFDDIETIKNNFLIVISNKKKLSVKYRLSLIYGEARSLKYTENLKEKRKNQDRSEIYSVFQKEFWVKKGYSEEESISLAYNQAKETSLKSVEKRKKNGTYKDQKFKIPISKYYWISRGYTEEEAEELRKPFLKECDGSLERYILKYGLEEGLQKFKERQLKRKLTNLQRYGSVVINGYTSKESLKFFKPLYKKLRKNGIKKEDIYWGIKGSKEYRLKSNLKNYNFFYDFTIKSKKIIIEYHNLFWHPRSNEIWKGIISEEDAIARDKEKKDLAIQNGFQYIEVWNDSNFKEKEKEILNVIFKRTI